MTQEGPQLQCVNGEAEPSILVDSRDSQDVAELAAQVKRAGQPIVYGHL